MQALERTIRQTPTGPALLQRLLRMGESKNAVADLIHKTFTELMAQSGHTAAVPEPPQLSAGKVFCTIELSCLVPRGKFKLDFAEKALTFSNAKARMQVPWTSLRAVAIIDNLPKDTKGHVLLFLHLGPDGAVQYGKQSLQALVIQMLATDQLDVASPAGSGRLQGPAPVVLCQALGICKQPHGVPFSSPSPHVFRTSSGALAVDAVVKVSQGHLYPLSDALCFLDKPALFIPLADVASMELCRAGGVSSTFDLLVHSHTGATQEFSNLPKAEVDAVTQYITARGLRCGSKEDATAASQEAEEGSSSEDSDFDPDREEGDSGGEPQGTSSGHGRRAANGTQASAAEDDNASEDLGNEEDEEEDGASDRASSDESLVSETLVSENDEEEDGEAAAAPAPLKRKRLA